MISNIQEKDKIDLPTRSIIETVKGYLRLINQGFGLKDKITILEYFLSTPLHLIYRKLSIPYDHKFARDVKLKNEMGIYNCGNGVSSVWSCNDFAEKHTRKFFEIDDGTFIDIGACIGKYSVFIARRLKEKGNVIAIEANEDNFKLLDLNIKLNNLNNAYIINAACCEKDGFINFYKPKNWYESSTSGSLEKDNNSIEIKSEAVKVDSIIKKFKIAKVNLIKIDVEEGAVDVLKGALETIKKHHPKIIFEILSKSKLKIATELLEKYNYKIDKIDDVNYFAYPK